MTIICCLKSSDYPASIRNFSQKPLSVPFFCTLMRTLPDWLFINRIALAFANSKAVTHFCLCTSELALRWYVLPPLERTMLHESSVSI
ncbi:hypothetical protein FKM82_031231 [Ascaphus truei]